MENKRNTNTNSRKSNTNNLRTSSKNSSKSTTNKSNQRNTTSPNQFMELMGIFWKGQGGKVVKIILAISIVFLINLLISRNDFSLYYLLLGIELLIGFAIIILRLVLQQKDLEG